MIIECLIERDGPTVINIEGVTYEFKRDGRGRNVCEVNNDWHVKRLLSMPRYYRSVPYEEVEQPLPDVGGGSISDLQTFAKDKLGVDIAPKRKRHK